MVLLPAVVYSVYEIDSLSTAETLMTEIYAKQLDVILFSLNQYAWDVANSWAGTVNSMTAGDDSSRRRSRIREFLQNKRSISAIIVTDSSLGALTVFRGDQGPGVPDENIRAALDSARDKLVRLARLKSADYRRLESLDVAGADTSGKQVALVFLGDGPPSTRHTLGMVIDPPLFIEDALSQRIREIAKDEFILAVLHRGDRQPVYTSSPVDPGDLRQSKDLWLLPDYSLAIRMQGETIGEIVHSRFYRNLGLLIVLDLVLLGGAWVVYRTMRQEMELVRLKSDFVSNVSHELRTPLSLIRMYAETLQMGRIQNEKQRQEYYSTMLNETERLTRLVNNMLNFSRMEAGRKHYTMHPTDVNALVRRVIDTYNPHLQNQGVTVSVECNDDIPEIRIDEESIAESLINILENAVKYSQEDKRIRVRTGREDGFVFIDVEDHGIGIPPDQQEKIFEKFYRVSTGLVHNTKGSGLGLALVKYIMEAHGGQVSVRSTPGAGSTFRMVLPSGGPSISETDGPQ